MLFSKTNNILLVVAIAVISLASLIISIAVFSKCRKCTRNSGATKGIKTLKIISAISIPIDGICLLISGTYLIMIFWFMTTRYYNSYGFGGEYYPGGVFLAISPFLVSLLGFFFCICAYSKSANTVKSQPPMLAMNGAPAIQYVPQPQIQQSQPAPQPQFAQSQFQQSQPAPQPQFTQSQFQQTQSAPQPQVQLAAHFCTKCGFKQSRADALFCENCGSKME